MRVTEHTLYKDAALLLPFIQGEDREMLYRAAEQCYKPCNMLTVDEFFGLLGGNYELLGDLQEPTLLQAMWLENFDRFARGLSDALAAMTLSPTAEQAKASQGIKKLEPQASMLVFIRKYFGLPSFVACGQITMGEYLTARQDKYNEAVVQRNMAAIQKNKLKKKSR